MGATMVDHPLTDLALAGGGHDDPDELYAAFVTWADEQGLSLYPHQDEAILELLSGSHVVLATPTGSGKTLVATAGHLEALASDRVSFYTAPIKALVNEKFFALCEVFGADQVGLLTGDASVNPTAPIICCTAEVLANIALREGNTADVGLVVMDEFHYYADPQRGWAWQVPLLELTDAQFILMSATLGDIRAIATDLSERTARDVALVTSATRPVPLSFTWALTPLSETLEEIVSTHRAPVYVVFPSQAQAADQARALHGMALLTRAERAEIAERIANVRFAAGFGRTLSGLLRKGIGVHHAGMLPRYRRIVEQLAQAGLLKVICGTDTLGVGINVPIRTVLFTRLVKFDGSRERLYKAREFHQIAGRAGRAGFDSSGEVVVQAPEHIIENARRLARAGDDPVKIKRVQRVKPEPGTIVWSEPSFEKLVAAAPEPGPARKGSLAFPPSSRSAPSGADQRCRLAINVTVRRGANGPARPNRSADRVPSLSSAVSTPSPSANPTGSGADSPRRSGPPSSPASWRFRPDLPRLSRGSPSERAAPPNRGVRPARRDRRLAVLPQGLGRVCRVAQCP
jgi:superfamily II RNA helicase